jgi:ferritin-like protein
MTLFLDFFFISTRLTDVSSDSILYSSIKVTEETVAFHLTAIVERVQSLHAKGMRILSIVGDVLSSQRAVLPDEDELNLDR